MFVFFSLYYVCLFFSFHSLNENVIAFSAVFKAFFCRESFQCVRIVYGLEPESVQVVEGVVLVASGFQFFTRLGPVFSKQLHYFELLFFLR